MPNPNKIPIDTTGFYNRSVDLMNKYKNLNFVQRAINPNLQKMTIPDPNPSNKDGFMSHRMSYAGDKYKMNSDIYKDAMKDYVKNTNIMKLIPKNKKGGSSKD